MAQQRKHAYPLSPLLDSPMQMRQRASALYNAGNKLVFHSHLNYFKCVQVIKDKSGS